MQKKWSGEIGNDNNVDLRISLLNGAGGDGGEADEKDCLYVAETVERRDGATCDDAENGI
jgi:hypothetical protein